MSETFSIYIVDESVLPMDLIGMSDEEIYHELITAVETNGELQTMVEMTEDDFVDALESIDKITKGDRLLPNCAMNNSPHEVLDKNSETPFIGYFSPAQAQRLLFSFDSLSEDSTDTIDSVETHSEVFEAFREAAETASGMEYAIAVLHA
jgi:hypothetical protein